MPRLAATDAASSRLFTSSFSRMLDTCAAAVFSVMKRLSPI